MKSIHQMIQTGKQWLIKCHWTIRKYKDKIEYWVLNHDGLVIILYFGISIALLVGAITYSNYIHNDGATEPYQVYQPYRITPTIPEDADDVERKEIINEIVTDVLHDQETYQFVYCSLMYPDHFLYILTSETVDEDYTCLSDENNLDDFIELSMKMVRVWQNYGYNVDIDIMLQSYENPDQILFGTLNGCRDYSCYDRQRHF